MVFKTLKDRMEYYKDLCDYKLTPGSYVLAHIDGRAFSKMIKKRFELPFDDKFIEMMNETAIYVCKNVQGCKLAYVQSDEISLVITDFDDEGTDSFFGYRLCKMQSIIASLATGYFNKLLLKNTCDCPCSAEDMLSMIDSFTPVQFDCKVWNVPTYNDTFAWLKYRQTDCIRNSKQQAAQTFLPKKSLFGMKADEQVERLKNEKGINWWNTYDDGKKYGRIIYKEIRHFTVFNKVPVEYDRSVWITHNGPQFTKEWYDSLNIVPKIDYINSTVDLLEDYVGRI